MIECYAFAMPNLPIPTPFNRKLMKQTEELLKSLEGMIAISPQYPHGTILMFETLNQAKIARNKIRATGNNVGKNIMTAKISDDMQNVEIGKPVD